MPGVNGEIRASLVHDDGTGEALYVAGQFTLAGDMPAQNVACWRGGHWESAGAGAPNSNALIVFQGELVAGGYLTSYYDGEVRRRSGGQWIRFGEVFDGAVRALVEFRGELYVGGGFRQVGEVAAYGIARWDGSAWQRVSMCPTQGTPGLSGGVAQLVVYDDRLVAGGEFVRADCQEIAGVAAWDGAEWHALGSGLSPPPSGPVRVKALLVSEGELFVGGHFSGAGGVPVSSVAAWTGKQWRGVGALPGPADVQALSVYDGALYASGYFESPAFPGSYFDLARCKGGKWTVLAASFLGGIPAWPTAWPVQTFSSWRGELYCGGSFHTLWTEEPLGANGVVAFDGAGWTSLGTGTNYEVQELCSLGDVQLAGGFFSEIEGDRAFGLARRTSGTWSSFGSGFEHAKPLSMTRYNGGVAADLGYWLNAAGEEQDTVAFFDGVGWSPLGAGAPTVARSLRQVGPLLICGGAGPTARVDVWNGETWATIGTFAPSPTQSFTWVAAVEGYAGRIVAGGLFSLAAGGPAANVAAWNGSAWSPLGGGTNGWVNALAECSGSLYVGGTFSSAGGMPALALARWDGSWHTVGGGVSYTPGQAGMVGAMLVRRGSLIVAGQFHLAGALPVGSIARWDGTQWDPMGGGLSSYGIVETLDEFQGQLVVGGQFTTAGGKVSAHIARYGCPCYPDCNQDGTLNLSDFGCFTTKFATSDPYADCNQDGVRNLADFGCFQTKFALGCP